MRKDDVSAGFNDPKWPSPEAHSLWSQFIDSMAPGLRRTWISRDHDLAVVWDAHDPAVGAPVRLLDRHGQTLICAPDGNPLGRLAVLLNPKWLGLAVATTT